MEFFCILERCWKEIIWAGGWDREKVYNACTSGKTVNICCKPACLKLCVFFSLMLLITWSMFLLLVLFHLKCMFFKKEFLNDLYYVKSSAVCCLNRIVNRSIDPLWICAACTEISHSEFGALLLQISVCHLRKTQIHSPFLREWHGLRDF